MTPAPTPPFCPRCGFPHCHVPSIVAVAGPLAVAVQAREDARRVREGQPASFRTAPVGYQGTRQGRWTR